LTAPKKNILLGLGDQKTKLINAPIPYESTVSPISCKGTSSFTSHDPLGMPQNATRWINRRLSQSCAYSCRDMLRDHSTADSGFPSPTKRTKLKNPSM
jgi:hypothetical protein